MVSTYIPITRRRIILVSVTLFFERHLLWFSLDQYLADTDMTMFFSTLLIVVLDYNLLDLNTKDKHMLCSSRCLVQYNHLSWENSSNLCSFGGRPQMTKT